MTDGLRLFSVLGFSSVHDALEAEAVLTRAGIETTVIPSPRELGELCGIAIRLEPVDEQRARAALHDAGRPPIASVQIHDR